MSKALIYIVFFCCSTLCSNTYSQKTNKNEVKKQLKKLFDKTEKDAEKRLEFYGWTICTEKEGEYEKLDTITMVNDHYHYLKGNCCYGKHWNFSKKLTFTISNTKYCQEPPLSNGYAVYKPNKIKFKLNEDVLYIQIFNDGKLIDSFMVISLDESISYNNKKTHTLKMLRIK
jgi:hypothetical protein